MITFSGYFLKMNTPLNIPLTLDQNRLIHLLNKHKKIYSKMMVKMAHLPKLEIENFSRSFTVFYKENDQKVIVAQILSNHNHVFQMSFDFKRIPNLYRDALKSYDIEDESFVHEISTRHHRNIFDYLTQFIDNYVSYFQVRYPKTFYEQYGFLIRSESHIDVKFNLLKLFWSNTHRIQNINFTLIHHMVKKNYFDNNLDQFMQHVLSVPYSGQEMTLEDFLNQVYPHYQNDIHHLLDKPYFSHFLKHVLIPYRNQPEMVAHYPKEAQHWQKFASLKLTHIGLIMDWDKINRFDTPSINEAILPYWNFIQSFLNQKPDLSHLGMFYHDFLHEAVIFNKHYSKLISYLSIPLERNKKIAFFHRHFNSERLPMMEKILHHYLYHA